jgi:hypothetical protein
MGYLSGSIFIDYLKIQAKLPLVFKSILAVSLLYVWLVEHLLVPSVFPSWYMARGGSRGQLIYWDFLCSSISSKTYPPYIWLSGNLSKKILIGYLTDHSKVATLHLVRWVTYLPSFLSYLLVHSKLLTLHYVRQTTYIAHFSQLSISS